MLGHCGRSPAALAGGGHLVSASAVGRRSCSSRPRPTGVKKQTNCPAGCGRAPAAGSRHRPPSLIGVYKGHMASGGAAVPARPAPTRTTAPPPAGRRWLRRVAPPAAPAPAAPAPAAVPVGSGRGRTRRRPPSPRHSTPDHPGCGVAAPPALSLLGRGPVGSRGAGRP